MPKEDMIEAKATLVETLPHSTFRVKVDTGQTIIAHRAGRMRIRNIRSVSGELVFSFDITALSPSRSPKKMTAGVLKKRNYEKLRFAYIRKHQ